MAPPCLVSARDADHARAAAEELSAGGDVRALKVGLQVTDDASVRAGAQALEDDPGRVDVLVNNAADVDWSETAPAPTWPPPTRSWRSTCSAPGGSPTPCCRCWGEATIPGW